MRQVFGHQMGLSDLDIVALSGGHTLVCSEISNYLVFLKFEMLFSYPLKMIYIFFFAFDVGKVPQGEVWI